MSPTFIARALLEKTYWQMTSVLGLLLISQLMTGCDVPKDPEKTRMKLDQVKNSAEERPPVAFELGKPMPPLPADVKVERRSYGGTGDIIEIKNLSRITIVTYEGRRIHSPTELTKVTRSDQGHVETVYMWVLPRPMPWKDAVVWFKDWLTMNGIEPGENLRKKMEIWSNNDIPGNEMPRNYPRQDTSGTDLTPTSALSVRWKPHPVRDWILVLGISLELEERRKLREAANEGETKEDEDRPKGKKKEAGDDSAE